MGITQKQIDALVRSFADAMEKAGEAFLSAGQIYVRALDLSPEAGEAIRKSRPGTTRRFWADIEAIGRGSLDHRVFAHAVPHLRRFPISEQKALMDSKVDVVLDDGRELFMDIASMPASVRRRALSYVGIRSVPEQKAMLATETTRRREALEARQASHDLKGTKAGLQVKCGCGVVRTIGWAVIARLKASAGC